MQISEPKGYRVEWVKISKVERPKKIQTNWKDLAMYRKQGEEMNLEKWGWRHAITDRGGGKIKI